MVKMLCFILLLMLNTHIFAQNVDVFALAKSNRAEIYIEQPVKIVVSVHTATWFTKPLNIENIQVDGAFVQSFKRTQSSIQYFDNKKYATLTFYYILFPYKSEELTFPELSISTETPPEGDYKGIQKKIRTKPINITVKSPPRNADTEHWLVATNASISQSWSKNLNGLKVGDVLKRTISIKANGTLPSFIDNPKVGEINFGTIYSSDPEFVDLRDNESVNGKRIDKYSYLLEKEGHYKLPMVTITWYNPYLSKYYQRSLPEIELQIAENNDFAELQALKDSLYAMNQPMNILEQETKDNWNYMLWGAIAIASILILIILRYIVKLFLKFYRKLKHKRKLYRTSEKYWFQSIKKAKTARELLNSSYRWIDASKQKFGYTTTTDFSTENQKLSEDISKMKENYFLKDKRNTVDLKDTKQEIKSQREKVITKKRTRSKRTIIDNINPD